MVTPVTFSAFIENNYVPARASKPLTLTHSLSRVTLRGMSDPPWRDDLRKLQRLIEQLTTQVKTSANAIAGISDELKRTRADVADLNERVSALEDEPEEP